MEISRGDFDNKTDNDPSIMNDVQAAKLQGLGVHIVNLKLALTTIQSFTPRGLLLP